MNKEEIQETYWYVSIWGTVCSTAEKSRTGKYLNTFKTKEEAIRYKEIEFAKQRLSKAIEEANEGWQPSFIWGVCNYCVASDGNNLSIICQTESRQYPYWMYIKDRRTAEAVLKENREDFHIVLEQ